jgi:hypothetical protein
LQVTIEPKRIVHRDATGRVINAYGGDGDFTTGRWGVRATKDPVTLKIHN